MRTPTLLAILAVAYTAPAAAHACATGYAYAGVEGWERVHGVAATIDSARRPEVAAGHVAAWVGIGGYGAGPGGSDIWLQAGISARRTAEPRLYYEVARPWRRPQAFALRRVAPGTPHRVAVIEMRRRPGWWRVWFDGAPATRPIRLGIRAAVEPTATSESWDGNAGACNAFEFRFRRLRVARTRGGWYPWIATTPFRDRGIAVRRVGRTAFSAASEPEPDRQPAPLPVDGRRHDHEPVDVATLQRRVRDPEQDRNSPSAT
jgi:hypothetical protein